MDMSKLACLSRPEDSSLPRNLSVFVNYESVMFYSKGPLCCAFLIKLPHFLDGFKYFLDENKRSFFTTFVIFTDSVN
jgi:hypothetical protein